MTAIEQLTFLLKITALILLIMIAVAVLQRARADDHVIRPDCWEENRGGQVYRHCDVHRPEARQPAARPPVYADGGSAAVSGLLRLCARAAGAAALSCISAAAAVLLADAWLHVRLWSIPILDPVT
jgi:hypothetical protein